MTIPSADIPDEAFVEAVPGFADDDPDDAFDAADESKGPEAAPGGALLQDLADVLRRAGLEVKEVDGWKHRRRGGAGYSTARPLGIIIHHTASRASFDGAPDAEYMTFHCENKPLANLYLDRSGRWWVLAAGATNTNGKGGPWGRIPENGANSRVLGIEAGNDGVGEVWPDVMQESYLRGVVALADAYDIDTNDVLSHREWAPLRKVDPAGPSRFSRGNQPWDMNRFRAEVAARRGNVDPLPPPPPPPPPDVTQYVVRPGDTWWGIAAKLLGDPRRNWSVLADANGGPGRVLRPGDVLVVPSSGPIIPAFPGVARLGDRGPVVRAWQDALVRKGVIRASPANRDGHYGNGMQRAVRNLQRSWGWTDADGTADERTWRRLHAT